MLPRLHLEAIMLNFQCIAYPRRRHGLGLTVLRGACPGWLSTQAQGRHPPAREGCALSLQMSCWSLRNSSRTLQKGQADMFCLQSSSLCQLQSRLLQLAMHPLLRSAPSPPFGLCPPCSGRSTGEYNTGHDLWNHGPLSALDFFVANHVFRKVLCVTLWL